MFIKLTHRIKLVLILVVLVLVSGCFPGTSGSNSWDDRTPPQSIVDAASEERSVTPPDNLVQRLKSYLNETADIPREAIALQSAQAVDWDTTCLGVAKADEFCAQVITPGYQIILDTPTGAFQFHTDRAGAFRLAQAPAD